MAAATFLFFPMQIGIRFFLPGSVVGVVVNQIPKEKISQSHQKEYQTQTEYLLSNGPFLFFNFQKVHCAVATVKDGTGYSSV